MLSITFDPETNWNFISIDPEDQFMWIVNFLYKVSIQIGFKKQIIENG